MTQSRSTSTALIAFWSIWACILGCGSGCGSGGGSKPSTVRQMSWKDDGVLVTAVSAMASLSTEGDREYLKIKAQTSASVSASRSPPRRRCRPNSSSAARPPPVKRSTSATTSSTGACSPPPPRAPSSSLRSASSVGPLLSAPSRQRSQRRTAPPRPYRTALSTCRSRCETIRTTEALRAGGSGPRRAPGRPRTSRPGPRSRP